MVHRGKYEFFMNFYNKKVLRNDLGGIVYKNDAICALTSLNKVRQARKIVKNSRSSHICVI